MKRFENPLAETIRIMYQYRRKILMDHVYIEHEVLKRFIGPDRTFHIYKIRRTKKK